MVDDNGEMAGLLRQLIELTKANLEVNTASAALAKRALEQAETTRKRLPRQLALYLLFFGAFLLAMLAMDYFRR